MLQLSAVTVVVVLKWRDDSRIRNRELDLKESEISSRERDIASRKAALAESSRRTATHELIRFKIPHDDAAEFVQNLWDEFLSSTTLQQ